MAGRLAGKVAIITGAARGQGEATARLFADEGAHVILADVLADHGEAVAADIGSSAQFMHLDVSDEDNWNAAAQAVLAAHGRIDVLVNNAAVTYHNLFQDTSKADLERVLAINLVGPYLGIRAVAPSMIERKAGSIVNISSVNGLRGTVR